MAEGTSEFVLGRDAMVVEPNGLARLIGDARRFYRRGFAHRRGRPEEYIDVEPQAGLGRQVLVALATAPLVFVISVVAITGIFGSPRGAPAVETAALETLETPAAVIRATAPAPAAFGEPVEIPSGAEAGAISLDGDRLAIRIDGPDGAEILIYDIPRGAVVARVPLVGSGLDL